MLATIEDAPATYADAGEVEDPGALAAPIGSVNHLPALLHAIRETHRCREDLLRAELRLTLQIKAIYRRLGVVGDQADHATQSGAVPLGATLHLEEARAVLHGNLSAYERQMEKLAKQLPVWPWVAGVRGFGAKGLAQIVGECGDLNNYASPAKLWKRMGLAVIEGERQRRVAGADALTHGYVPRRRSLMWNIGESLIKGNRDGFYRAYYLAEKERQRDKLGPDAPQIHVHNRARRHMEKLLLKHLWQAWRELTPA